MCCIFTCCGWMIDLIQRAWVFAMSCCISSAVCCVLLTSSMSGVALGYNYSLAEYMDLKETNVSIYLKRGIFDDDVSNDMDWRRSAGHKAVRGFANDEGDLLTQEPDDAEKTPLRSGRRLDDSILESNDNNKFEGSLMKLTARPPHHLSTKPPVTSDMKMQEIFSQYPQGSLDQLKAIQSLISMRKSAAARDSKNGKMSTYAQEERYVPDFPGVPLQARRMMSMNAQDPRSEPDRGALTGPVLGQGPFKYEPPDMNPARLAVPDNSIGEWRKWMAPKPSPWDKSVEDSFTESHTYPQPIRYMTGPVRPTRPTELIPTNTEEPVTIKAMKAAKEPIDRGMEDFKEKLILDKYESPRLKIGRQKSQKSDIEYYEDEVKGLPVRKKRNISRVKRKVAPKALHQKLQRSYRDNAPDKGEEISITNEITNKPSILVSRLLYSGGGPDVSKMKAVSDTSSTTDGIVKILRSMFS